MVSTFTSKEGSLIHWWRCYSSHCSQRRLPSRHPAPTRPQVHPSPVPRTPSCRSCLGPLLPAAPRCRGPPTTMAAPQHIPGLTAARPFWGSGPQPGSGREMGNAAHGWQQGERAGSWRDAAATTQLHPPSPSAPGKPAALNTRSLLLRLSPIPSPAGLYSAVFFRTNSSASQVPFHFVYASIFFPPFLTREVSHAQAPQEQPLPSYHCTETHPPLPGKCYLAFSSVHFQRQETAKNAPPFRHEASHKAGHGLPHCGYVQGTCSKHLAPAKPGRGKPWWFLPLIQDFSHATAQVTPPLTRRLFLVLLPNEGNKPNKVRKPATQTAVRYSPICLKLAAGQMAVAAWHSYGLLHISIVNSTFSPLSVFTA